MASLTRNFSIYPEVLVTAETEPIFVGDNSSNEFDTDWKFVDAAGHGHFVEKGKPNRLPTLKWVSDGCSMGHGDNCDSEGHHECLLCSETIEPATKTVYGPTHIPGRTTITVTMEHANNGGSMTTVWELAPEDLQRVRGAVAACLFDTLKDRVVDQTVTFGGFR